jgi:hypothetical protein
MGVLGCGAYVCGLGGHSRHIAEAESVRAPGVDLLLHFQYRELCAVSGGASPEGDKGIGINMSDEYTELTHMGGACDRF